MNSYIKICIATIIIIFGLSSCKSMKFIELDEFEFSSLNGNINKIYFYKYSKYNLKDTLQSIVYYNKNRKAIKQIDFYGKDSITTISTYDSKNRLIKEVSNSKDNLTCNYFYDDKDNLIKYQQLNNGDISFEKKMIYDKNQNIIEENYYKREENDTTKYVNNYKKRTKTTVISKDKKSSFYNKKKYNNKGYMISSESCFNEKDTVFLTFEYDKKINLLKRTSYINGKLNFKDTRKNKYDKKGNLIEMTIYSDENFISRETFVIDYK